MWVLIAGQQITLCSKTISKALGTHTVIACLQVFSNWINAEPKECLLPGSEERWGKTNSFLRVTWDSCLTFTWALGRYFLPKKVSLLVKYKEINKWQHLLPMIKYRILGKPVQPDVLRTFMMRSMLMTNVYIISPFWYYMLKDVSIWKICMIHSLNEPIFFWMSTEDVTNSWRVENPFSVQHTQIHGF